MSSSISGILHTDSSKFKAAASSFVEGGASYNNLFDQDVVDKDLENALKIARQHEIAFYSMYFPGVTEYRTFIERVRELFQEAGKDYELIKGLSNDKLKKFVPKDKTDIGTELQLEINFTTEPGFIELDALDIENYGVKMSTDKKGFAIVITEENVQDFIKDLRRIVDRAFEKDSTWKGETTPGGPLQGQKLNETLIQHNMKKVDTVIAWFDRQSPERLEKMGLKATIKDLPAKSVKETDTIKAKAQPFAAYKKSDIKEKTGDPEFEKNFKIAFNKVKKFMLDPLLKGSKRLEDAATAAWKSLVGEINSELRGYFFEGKNLDKSILGNGGEFQLQIFHNYLALANKEYKGELGEVIGGIGSGKRQEPRSDFQIMSMLGADIGDFVAGVQVKNVSEGTGTKIHTSSDLELMAPGMPENFRDALANAQFNTDIFKQVPDIEQTLKDYVEKYFWRAMNLHVSEGLNPNHTNTFYMFRGTSLIPASEIIKDMMNENSTTKKPTFTVTGFTKPTRGDADYAERDENGKPLFLEWFDSVSYLGFGRGAVVDADTYNHSEYNRLLMQVSVNSSFSLSAVASSLKNQGGSIELFPH